MNKALPHLIRTTDLFCNYDVTKLIGKGNIKRKYKAKDKKALVNKIFLRYLHIMFSDIIEGGKEFVFPSSCITTLHMGRIQKKQLITARNHGAFRDLDLLKSNFTCYELLINFNIGKSKFKMPMRLSHNYRERMVEKMNDGYKYC